MKKTLCLSLVLILASCAQQNEPWYLSTINKRAFEDEKQIEVKCALLDSGFDDGFQRYFQEDSVLPEINLIEGETEHLNLHGTYLSMLIASKEYGVDSNISLLPIRILDYGGSTNSELVLKGLEAAKENECKVVNMSFGSTYYSEEIQNFIKENSDMIFVSSVGDMNQNEFFYPANYDGVYAISAVDKNNEIFDYSNTSSAKESILAPGVDIPLPGRTGEIVNKTGSSFSSALVSGIICASLLRGNLNIDNLVSNNLYTNGHLDCKKFLR